VKEGDGSGVGTRLDCFRWDYQPPAVDRRFFLKPVGDFFGAFHWDGRDEISPVTEDRAEATKQPDD